MLFFLQLRSWFLFTDVTRILDVDPVGRAVLKRINKPKPIGFVIMLYPNRAMEWINLKQLFEETLAHFDFSQFSMRSCLLGGIITM